MEPSACPSGLRGCLTPRLELLDGDADATHTVYLGPGMGIPARHYQPGASGTVLISRPGIQLDTGDPADMNAVRECLAAEGLRLDPGLRIVAGGESTSDYWAVGVIRPTVRCGAPRRRWEA